MNPHYSFLFTSVSCKDKMVSGHLNYNFNEINGVEAYYFPNQKQRYRLLTRVEQTHNTNKSKKVKYKQESIINFHLCNIEIRNYSILCLISFCNRKSCQYYNKENEHASKVFIYCANGHVSSGVHDDIDISILNLLSYLYSFPR